MNSILFTEEEKRQGINKDSIHPLEYVHARNYQLQNIQQTISVKKSIQNSNKLDSVYLTNLFDQYKRKHEDIQKKRKEQERFLNPNHYDTILMNEAEWMRTKKLQSGGTFGNTNQYSTQGAQQVNYNTSSFNQQENNGSDEEEYFTKAEIREQERLKNELYGVCVEGSDIDQNQILGSVFDRPIRKGEQVLYSVIEKQKEDDQEVKELLTLKKEWLKEINDEIQQINKQNKKLKQRAEKSEVCRNYKLLSKLAPSLFTQFHVYFDDIFNALMDEILEEEVEYFNEVESMEIKQLDEHEKNKQTFKLKEVVRNQALSSHLFGLIDGLDQYADLQDRYDEDY